MRNTVRQTRDNRTITVDFHDETTKVFQSCGSPVRWLARTPIG